MPDTAWIIATLQQAIRCAIRRLDDLDAMEPDERDDDHSCTCAEVRQAMELYEMAATEIERLQADKARLDALEEMTEVNGYVGLWSLRGRGPLGTEYTCHTRAGARRIPQSIAGLRGVLDNLREWMAEDKAQREADRL
jgi:hypothetical protein